MRQHSKFLEFNGKNIIFINVEGVYWIAIRPICEALNVNARRSIDNIKKDPILGPAGTVQYVQVENNGIIQGRKMTCIPEQYIYGWIFSLRSDSPELTEYKRTCYQLLFNHFHGTITNRKELLLERKDIDTEIHQINAALKEQDDKFKRLEQLKKEKKQLNSKLNHIDKELIKEPELFE